MSQSYWLSFTNYWSWITERSVSSRTSLFTAAIDFYSSAFLKITCRLLFIGLLSLTDIHIPFLVYRTTPTNFSIQTFFTTVLLLDILIGNQPYDFLCLKNVWHGTGSF